MLSLATRRQHAPTYFRSNVMKFVKIALAIATFLPLASHATLGGAPSAASTAPKSLRSMLQNTAAYSVHASVDADGVAVRDMGALLGSYFQRFVSAGEGRAHGTGPMIERSGDLVIQSAGRPGYFSGKAYVPRLVPANVSADDLQQDELRILRNTRL
jgi:hypothetical protein